MTDLNAHERRHTAAHAAFSDVLGQLRLQSEEPAQALIQGEIDPLDGATVATLLEKNFAKLDPNGNGITKEELAQALLTPSRFTADEYVMLKLVGRYFDTIANMCEDEVGSQTVITGMDKDVLNQFLLNSKLSLSDLHRWRSIDTHLP